MNSIGSAGCATTSDVSASDKGSPTVRFRKSASIAVPGEPTVVAISCLSVAERDSGPCTASTLRRARKRRRKSLHRYWRQRYGFKRLSRAVQSNSFAVCSDVRTTMRTSHQTSHLRRRAAVVASRNLAQESLSSTADFATATGCLFQLAVQQAGSPARA